MAHPKRVFVTVGTTLFDELIRAVDDAEALRVLADLGYTEVLMQTGKGTYAPEEGGRPCGVTVTSYRFKPTLTEDMAAADLIISHAGAGSVMEALALGKPLVVVVNARLMGNHQCELAQAMADRGHAVATTPEELSKALRGGSAIAALRPRPPPPRPDAFLTVLNEEVARGAP